MDVTDAIYTYVTKRFEGINKFLMENAQVEVKLSRTTNHHKSGDIFRAEVNIQNNGDQTYAAEEKADLYAAIDALRDEVMQILSSKKGKRESLWKRGKQKIKNLIKGSQ